MPIVFSIFLDMESAVTVATDNKTTMPKELRETIEKLAKENAHWDFAEEIYIAGAEQLYQLLQEFPELVPDRAKRFIRAAAFDCCGKSIWATVERAGAASEEGEK